MPTLSWRSASRPVQLLVAVCAAALLLGGLYVAYKIRARMLRPAPPLTERMVVRKAMAARPDGLWPRGKSHAVLAYAGTRERQKAYYEPGGSFSPVAGSFGVALWVVDQAGAVVATSDSIPMSELEQRLVPAIDPNEPPGIAVETKSYAARWTIHPQGVSKLGASAKAGSQLAIAVRSVGPAGGAIHKLRYEGGRLIINDRFSVSFAPAPSALKLAEEPSSASASWSNPGQGLPAQAAIESRSGWAFARADFKGAPSIAVEIRELWPVAKSPLPASPYASSVKMSLPDPRFAASLDAQVAHLTMSLVGRSPRPGEPINYPLSWLRDGAYSVVALVRAGQVPLARDLALPLLERDFFGGFGPEADGPGVALWALDEISQALQDREFDRTIYPHVYRKAAWIERMMKADRPIDVHPIDGPIVPSWLGNPELARVCEAASEGLIVGRMDGHRPILYVNAISYLGLTRAARLADRVGETAHAAGLRARAGSLKSAWARGFKPPERDNDRTAISTLWPSGIGYGHEASFEALLDERWKEHRTADGGYKSRREWTYFDAAEMHQWMRLGKLDRMWQTLEYFWSHQASPGLYTWGEGSGEENSFGLWEEIRGWVAPEHVTPHYWTASEVLLAQLEMLAYADDSGAELGWVIGGGVPAAWIDEPMSVSGVGTSHGVVDWRWTPAMPGTPGNMEVTIRGERGPVRLGSAFGTAASVNVQYAQASAAPSAIEPSGAAPDAADASAPP
jgi:hypothetical protein